jgi:hypothetical protein
MKHKAVRGIKDRIIFRPFKMVYYTFLHLYNFSVYATKESTNLLVLVRSSFSITFMLDPMLSFSTAVSTWRSKKHEDVAKKPV